MRRWDGEPTFKLEAPVRELRGKTAVKKGPPKKAISDLPDTEELKSPPLILVNGLLVCHRKGQTVNILTRNKNRSSLPSSRRRKGMTGCTGLCGFTQWPGTPDSQKYKALVNTGAQCMLIPSGYKGTEPIWISGVTGGCQALSVLEAEVNFTGHKWEKPSHTCWYPYYHWDR